MIVQEIVKKRVVLIADQPLYQEVEFQSGSGAAVESARELRDLISKQGGEEFEALGREVEENLKFQRKNPRRYIQSWHGVVNLAYGLERIGSAKISMNEEVDISEGFGDRVKKTVFGDRQEKLVEEAFLRGFLASKNGFNGEYTPHLGNHDGENPDEVREEIEDLIEDAKSDLLGDVKEKSDEGGA